MSRLKLRDDAYYVATDDGICLLTNSGEVTIKGASIFQWVDRLAPYLDGRHGLADLTAAMPAERRAMTERVVNALRSEGVVVEVTEDRARHSLVLVGAGAIFDEISRAASAAGLRTLDALPGADFALYAGDDLDEARRLDEMCAGAQVPFACAIEAGAEIWLGPFGTDRGDWPRWTAAWSRLDARVGPASRNPAAPTVVASQLIRQMLRTGGRRPWMSRIDVVGLGTTIHMLPVSPVDGEDFDRRVTALLDDRLGVLGNVTEGDLPQVPLCVSQVAVRTANPVVVNGFGLTHEEARRAAVMRGLTVYGSSTAGAGHTWSEAFRAGLLGLCLRRTIDEVARSDAAYAPIRWDGYPLDATGSRYSAMVKAIDLPLDVYDVTGSLGVPTLAFWLEDSVIAYANGFSFGDALREGLGETIFAYQLGPRELPEHRRGNEMVQCPEWTVDEASLRVVAVAVDQDPAAAAVLPYLLDVVWADG